MKTIAIALALLSTTCFSQTYITQVKLADTKKWGYANEKGELIIPAQFDRCNEFTSDGLAAVYDKNTKLFSFIDPSGAKLETEFTGFELLDASNFGVDGVGEGFHSGRAAVKNRGKWGYFGTDGRLAITMKYDEVTVFDEGFAVGKIGANYVVLNTNGEEATVDVIGILDIKHFSEKFAPYRAADKQYGFIDDKGKVVIPAKFKNVGYFRNGLAWARTNDGLLGYIDATGAWVIKPQFDYTKDFDAESGMARIKDKDRWGYVDRSGTQLHKDDTEFWGDFSEGLAEGRKGALRGFFNNKGEWVIAPQFDGVRDFKNGFAAAKKNDLWGMIDKEGKWVIQPKFITIKDMERVGQ